MEPIQRMTISPRLGLTFYRFSTNQQQVVGSLTPHAVSARGPFHRIPQRGDPIPDLTCRLKTYGSPDLPGRPLHRADLLRDSSPQQLTACACLSCVGCESRDSKRALFVPSPKPTDAAGYPVIWVPHKANLGSVTPTSRRSSGLFGRRSPPSSSLFGRLPAGGSVGSPRFPAPKCRPSPAAAAASSDSILPLGGGWAGGSG